ncbi:MAG: 50S ribosomal protein L25 [Desulfobulbaceae bacterium]|uniref:Large ribosomal subunit protein bL25 n=1 Tax=Candidatus Desulfobia pelagia TaxID=2841692 RepID=A0A8J6TFP8_9BACT|nr:50S ribosomal protein L25 [Candidatus Desulfobia pelagia]
MLQLDVTARVRSNFGKGAARSLRRAGRTPAVLYGPGAEPLILDLDSHSFTKSLLKIRRRNAVINLEVEGNEGVARRHVLVKELQVHPVQDSLIHADFYEIALDKPSVFAVPVKYEGKAIGVELGGELSTPVTAVNIEGLPLDIPDLITLNVTKLKLGKKLTCADMVIPGNVTLLEDLDTVCVAVVTATIIPDEEEEEEAAAAEGEDAAEGSEEAPAAE